MKTQSYIRKSLFIAIIALAINACKEDERYKSASNDKTPPGVPTDITWEPLYGGARFHYTIPPDEDLISVDAEFTNAQGKTFRFTSSFYKDSLDVYGLGDTLEHVINLFGVDRAGNRSTLVPVTILPKESAITRVAKSLDLKPGFSSFILDWTNELKQIINVYVYYKYTESGSGTVRDMVSVFSSNIEEERRFVNNLLVDPDSPIEISLQVEDQYGNITPQKSLGEVFLQPDEPIDKTAWHIPEAADSFVILRNGEKFNSGVPAMFGDNLEGRMTKLIDNIIDRGDNLNFFHTGGRGRTGLTKDGNLPWNIIIDLGGYYKLSRISTVQRHSGGLDNMSIGQYYRDENCGHFRLYVFNEELMRWDTCSEQKTPIPTGVSDLQIILQGEAGDMTYFYPDDPKYTAPTRWLRYEAIRGFQDNYTSTNVNCMSELSLWGIKAE